MVLKPKAPCSQTCERRKVGCHSVCPEYQAYEEKKLLFYQEKLKEINGNPPKDYMVRQIIRINNPRNPKWDRKEL